MSDIPNGKALAKCLLITENEKYTLNQRICSLSNYDLNPIFFTNLLNRHQYFLSFNDGNGQTNLRKDDILKCPLIVPPIELQNQFAACVARVDKSKFTLQNSIISLMNLSSLWYNMSNMFSSGYMGRLELIRALPTKEEKAKASRLVLREVLEQIFPEKSAKKKKKYSLLELIDCAPIKNYVNDDQVTESLHFIRIIGIRAEHNQPIREKDVKIAVDNLENFIKFLDHRNESTEPIKSPEFFTEAETRAAYIDMYLREAGWDVLTQKGVALPGKAGIEIEVGNMPNNAGVGYCDYVLYDRAGKPLAVVEAKKTSKDPQIGRHQADLYAESLKEKFGYKPVIYYTNGYETHVIDGVYPDRKVTAFHTLEELERMIQRRTRGNITDMAAKDEIAGRPYQKMALTRMCERFNARHRRGLVVMATGTGKTRVSIALTDILARNGWIKNVLFLADRTSLVKQAKRNYAKLLPDMTICELSEGGNANKDMNARLMFCTYQTMINYIDAEDKDFSTGRFDLIIVDEAHRSIFNRYASIFAYFDSLLVGFTATPRDEVGSSTYGIFECESGEPTFDYPLEDAIKEHYLVGYEVINRHSRIMTQGIKREELDEDQLEQLDDFLEGDRETPDLTIPANAIFRSIFNEDTCRSVIEDLMEKGIRVNGGETIGKTIIFAYNHKHAEMIVNEFKKLYPHLPPNTCQLVDYSVNYAEDLVVKFDTDDEFRVAVSVDMLDTGIDVPAVSNLMFFKPVRSKIKFVQMIGRGTRLCPDLFGPGNDKKKFLIFDYCDNFEYFQVEHNEVVSCGDKISLSQRIFALRSEIAYSLQDFESQEDEFLSSYRNK
ncbi:DEAD/DEAH box helicase family protein, partial [Candidatus Saccharibacteria bacterium]|nr:DEAD/DEAH box helicase family protein [Candidatus Saccharibacteria bacterium]